MTRYVIIALMNLLVVGSIAASALFALIRGCNMDGTCTGSSNTLTWVLGVGLSLAVVAALAIVGRTMLKRRRAVGHQDIAIAAMPRALFTAGDVATEDDSDEAMLSRLARMTRATAEDTAVVESDHAEPVELNRDGEKFDEASVFDDDFGSADDVVQGESAEGDSIDAEREETSDAVAAPSDGDSTAPGLHVVVRDGERTAPRPFSFELESDDAVEGEHRFAWLFDSNASTNTAHVRRDVGFPWSIVGIDHVCQGVSRFGLMLAGTDVASEASAWCQVTASLPRGEALADEDAIAFTDWLNASLSLIGRSGEAMIEEALAALEAEAASDPAVARCLPRDFWTDSDFDDSRIARFG